MEQKISNLRTIQELDVNKKNVIVRVDLNLPIVNGRLEDNTRIIRLLPTLEYLITNNAKIIILSHFGRPQGKVDRDMSLAPIADELSKALSGKEVKFGVDCIGKVAQEAIAKLDTGEVILMENLRFYPGEEENDIVFAKELAKLGEVYINDTFSCSHRAHASITSLAHLLPSGAGFLLQEELSNLERLLSQPQLPIAAIVGGSKVSTKLDLLYSLVKQVSLLVIGGAMANTFLKSKGFNIGKSLHEHSLIDKAKEIIDLAAINKCELLLPIDVVTSTELKQRPECRVVTIDQKQLL
jgi:phosphoglycerate kinase